MPAVALRSAPVRRHHNTVVIQIGLLVLPGFLIDIRGFRCALILIIAFIRIVVFCLVYFNTRIIRRKLFRTWKNIIIVHGENRPRDCIQLRQCIERIVSGVSHRSVSESHQIHAFFLCLSVFCASSPSNVQLILVLIKTLYFLQIFHHPHTAGFRILIGRLLPAERNSPDRQIHQKNSAESHEKEAQRTQDHHHRFYRHTVKSPSLFFHLSFRSPF